MRSWRRKGREGTDLVRVVAAVREARRYIPEYGSGRPIATGDVRRLAGAVQLQVHRARGPMDIPAVLLPPISGRYRLVIADELRPELVRHVTLHEIGHILSGDIDEPTFLTWAGPMPEAEDVADLFALVAQLDDDEVADDPAAIETRILELVPLEVPGWAGRRVPRLAGKIGALKNLLREADDA